MDLTICPVIFGAAATIYAISLLIMRYVTCESDSATHGLSHLLKIMLTFALAVYIMRTGHDQKNVLALGTCVFEFIFCRQMYLSFVAGTPFKKVDLNGKVYIVTGSNTGLGFDTARELVKMGATVVMACRSVDKANEARSKILELTKCAPSKVMVMKIDLCGFDSVRKFVKEFRESGLHLHGLINNAGMIMEERSLTQDGFEMVFTANHLSHFLLTNLLLPELVKTNGRIVNVTSSLHKTVSGFNFDDVMSEKNYNQFVTYSQSKLANILFTVEMQRRLTEEGKSVTCNAVHPGIVRTEFTRNMGFLMQLGNMLVAPLLMIMQKTPLQGAYCSIHVATSPDLEGVGGLYFVQSQPAETSQGAKDSKAASRLWELSQKLTGLRQ